MPNLREGSLAEEIRPSASTTMALLPSATCRDEELAKVWVATTATPTTSWPSRTGLVIEIVGEGLVVEIGR